MTSGTEQFFEVWKQQVNAGLQILDAVAEATAKMRSAQSAAANEMHQRTVEAEKLLAGVKDAQELWNAQCTWASETAERAAAYWRNQFEAMTEANARILKLMQERMQAAMPAEPGANPSAAGLAAVDNAFREMLKTSQHLLTFTTGGFGAAAAPTAGASKKKGV
jgi:cystathionine beta-lyase/cystathionine gamma-synthase